MGPLPCCRSRRKTGCKKPSRLALFSAEFVLQPLSAPIPPSAATTIKSSDHLDLPPTSLRPPATPPSTTTPPFSSHLRLPNTPNTPSNFGHQPRDAPSPPELWNSPQHLPCFCSPAPANLPAPVLLAADACSGHLKPPPTTSSYLTVPPSFLSPAATSTPAGKATTAANSHPTAYPALFLLWVPYFWAGAESVRPNSVGPRAGLRPNLFGHEVGPYIRPVDTLNWKLGP
ncbi:classical arabinogalactan protein 9-like [Rhodamnia argentea]|uniref:Classical arabinogalactan protein 9-like n=1 Tax=Rhodamnia argentea TaxID=178133 RepID=A0ABM3HMG0_9MYRT|nr:classical arabinogalactan protein 9-like [Rhodamnia argentea]